MAAVSNEQLVQRQNYLALQFAQQGSERNARQLMIAMEKLVRLKVQRYAKGPLADDALQAAHIALFNAAKTYDPSRAAFATHFANQVLAELKTVRSADHVLGRQAYRVGYRAVTCELSMPRESRMRDPKTAGTLTNNWRTATGDWDDQSVSIEGELDQLVMRRLLARFLTAYTHDPKHRPLLARRNRLIAECTLLFDRSNRDVALAIGFTEERCRQIVKQVYCGFVRWLEAQPSGEGTMRRVQLGQTERQRITQDELLRARAPKPYSGPVENVAADYNSAINQILVLQSALRTSTGTSAPHIHERQPAMA